MVDQRVRGDALHGVVWQEQTPESACENWERRLDNFRSRVDEDVHLRRYGGSDHLVVARQSSSRSRSQTGLSVDGGSIYANPRVSTKSTRLSQLTQLVAVTVIPT